MRETLLGFLDRIKPDIIVIEDVPFKKISKHISCCRELSQQ